jgi:hypothetical protein
MYNLLNNYNSVILYAQYMVHVFLLLTLVYGAGMKRQRNASPSRDSGEHDTLVISCT